MSAARATAPDTDALRAAFSELLGAERRLRGRDPHGPGTLSYAQVRSLARLEGAGEASAGQLAEAADVAPASMSAMLDQLERQGVLQRRRDPRDRRIVLVSLTPAGSALLAERRARWRDCWQAALEPLPERDLAAAGDVMHRLARMLDEL